MNWDNKEWKICVEQKLSTNTSAPTTFYSRLSFRLGNICHDDESHVNCYISIFTVPIPYFDIFMC